MNDSDRRGTKPTEKEREGAPEEWAGLPVRSPALWAGPPSFTFFTKMVSMGSRRCRGEGPGGQQSG